MKRNIETYIIIKDNKIIRVYKTSQGQPGIMASLKYEKIADYDEIKKVDNKYEGKRGMDLKEICNDGKIRPLDDRIIEGLRPCPQGKKVQHGQIVDKSTLEKIRDKEILVSDYQIYDEATDTIRDKTPEEIYTPEELAAQERERLISLEIRKIAEERLIASGKITPIAEVEQ